MAKMGNPVSKRLAGIVTPLQGGWFIVLEYAPIGYVAVNESGKLDFDGMLEAIRLRNEACNVARSQKRWPTIEIDGWNEPPFYDPILHALETSLRAKSNGRRFTNHSLRLYGRRGVVQITLVGSQRVSLDLTALTAVAEGVVFHPGERYTDYRVGDPLAPGGLVASLTTDDPSEILEQENTPALARGASFPMNSTAATNGQGIVAGEAGLAGKRESLDKLSPPFQLIGLAVAGGTLLLLIPLFIWFGRRHVDPPYLAAQANQDAGETTLPGVKLVTRRKFRVFGRLQDKRQRQVNTMYNYRVTEEVSRAPPYNQVPLFFSGMAKRGPVPHVPFVPATMPDQNAAPTPVKSAVSSEDQRLIETMVRALLNTPEIQHLLARRSPDPSVNLNIVRVDPIDEMAASVTSADADCFVASWISPVVPRELRLGPRAD